MGWPSEDATRQTTVYFPLGASGWTTWVTWLSTMLTGPSAWSAAVASSTLTIELMAIGVWSKVGPIFAGTAATVEPLAGSLDTRTSWGCAATADAIANAAVSETAVTVPARVRERDAGISCESFPWAREGCGGTIAQRIADRACYRRYPCSKSSRDVRKAGCRAFDSLQTSRPRRNPRSSSDASRP
jgi:hypothetical protein